MEKKKKKKETNQLITKSEVESKLDILVEGQTNNSKQLQAIRNDLQRGFIGLALRNQELVELNKELTQQLGIVVSELNAIQQEREEKEIRKQARQNRKRLPKREPMTHHIYKELIRAAEGPTYLSVRLRIAFCILAVTGIRINELLPLKVYQLETLIHSNWIAIDRSKRGPSNHKAFLTKEGKKIIEDRKKDFELIFLMKESNSYVFTSEANHYQMLSRETITKDVNRAMRSVSNQFTDTPNITSHSFRVGYITQLWKDTKDIEFVKQAIGHRSMGTTSSYVDILSDKEREERMDQI
ncbi:MAG: tyrosine-type recombinase/integrase [Kordia sp.]|uniref:tyrosine-type recombinase/integrase n=1 Tax=Kordia sp. TaxID=1965332 RepID=UPI00385A4B53